jgi:hypothetical protein
MGIIISSEENQCQKNRTSRVNESTGVYENVHQTMQIEVTRWSNTKRKTRALIRVRYCEGLEKEWRQRHVAWRGADKFERGGRPVT